MKWYLFCIVLPAVTAALDWPPTHCPQPIQISKDGALVMTAGRIRNIKTECLFEETFRHRVYIKFSRRYNTEQIEPRTESIMGLEILFGSVPRFTVEMHNDRLKLLHDEDEDIDVSSNKCLTMLASNSRDWFNWMRIRANHLREIRRTFVSVDLASSDGNVFTPCMRFELKSEDTDFQIKAYAKSDAGMIQEIQKITEQRPDLNKMIPASLTTRMDRLEKKINRIHSTLNQYMRDHENHVVRTKKETTNLKQFAQNTKNNLQNKSNSHTLMFLFMFGFAITGLVWFINYKFTKQNRWKL